MKHILVTGGAGFIGSHTVDLLLSRGYQVRVLDNLSLPVHRSGQIPDYFSEQAEFMAGDVRNKADWERALESIDAVYHFAAYQDYLPDFSKFFHINTVGTALLYEVIVEHGFPIQKVVVASSQAVYGEGKYHCAADGVQYPSPRPTEQLEQQDWSLRCPQCGAQLNMIESDEERVHPHNSYAMSKNTQEMIAFLLGRRYDIPSVALRYSIVQGARQSFRNAYSGVLRIFAMQLLATKRPTVYEDGEQIRDYVYVGDVARANLMALEDARADFHAFNVGGGRQVTVNEFARIMAEVVGQPDVTPFCRGEYRFGDTRHISSDIGRLAELGWQPIGTAERAVAEYLEWAQKQADFGDYATQARENMRKLGTVRGGW